MDIVIFNSCNHICPNIVRSGAGALWPHAEEPGDVQWPPWGGGEAGGAAGAAHSRYVSAVEQNNYTEFKLISYSE